MNWQICVQRKKNNKKILFVFTPERSLKNEYILQKKQKQNSSGWNNTLWIQRREKEEKSTETFTNIIKRKNCDTAIQVRAVRYAYLVKIDIIPDMKYREMFEGVNITKSKVSDWMSCEKNKIFFITCRCIPKILMISTWYVHSTYVYCSKTRNIHILTLHIKAMMNNDKNKLSKKHLDPNFQVLTHRPPSGGLKKYKNYCTKKCDY